MRNSGNGIAYYASYTSHSNTYNNSDLDNYLESTVYNAFASEVKNALNNMNVVSNEVIQRHIVAPSLAELGIISSDYTIEEGIIYPIFSPASNYNSKSIFNMPDTGYPPIRYWTRSKRTYNNSDVWAVYDDGSRSDYHCNNTCALVARIRFAKA